MFQNPKVHLTTCGAACLALAFASSASQAQDDAYSRSCAACHGAELRGGETGPALIGSVFQQHWAALPPIALDTFTRHAMPPTNPASLSEADYTSALTRIRRANGWPVSAAAVPARHTFTEWLNNRGDLASSSYSPLDQINRDNVS